LRPENELRLRQLTRSYLRHEGRGFGKVVVEYLLGPPEKVRARMRDVPLHDGDLDRRAIGGSWHGKTEQRDADGGRADDECTTHRRASTGIARGDRYRCRQ